MTDFSLRQRVVQVMAETGAVDPGEIADKVGASLSDQERWGALDQALRSFVRDVIGNQRMQVNGARPAGSRKVRGVREHFNAMVAQPVHCGAQGWKALGDCTADDLRAAAAENRALAARTAEKADKYDKLADAIERAGVPIARRLKAQVLVAALETVMA